MLKNVDIYTFEEKIKAMKKLILCLSAVVLISTTVFAQNKSDLQTTKESVELKDSKFIFKKHQLSKDDLEKIESYKNLKFDTLKLNKEQFKEYSKYIDSISSLLKDSNNISKSKLDKELKKYKAIAENMQTNSPYEYNMPVHHVESSDSMPTLKVKSEDKMPILKPKKDKK